MCKISNTVSFSSPGMHSKLGQCATITISTRESGDPRKDHPFLLLILSEAIKVTNVNIFQHLLIVLDDAKK